MAAAQQQVGVALLPDGQLRQPHDKQFFWAGSEADRYYPTFDGKPYKPYIAQYRPVPSEENPPSVGYPALPGNWESDADLVKHGKPDTQQVFRSFQELIWGGVSDRSSSTTTRPPPAAPRPRAGPTIPGSSRC